MKTVSLVFVLAFVSHFAKGQVIVDGVNINKLDSVIYVDVYMFGKVANYALKTVWIDFGQPTFGGSSQTIQGSSGKERDFKTNVEVLNFMHRNGWEFVQARSTHFNTLSIYTMKRKE